LVPVSNWNPVFKYHVSIITGTYRIVNVAIQVGRTGMDPDEFKTLLAAASFMGPDEARVQSMIGRVRKGLSVSSIS
jgi:hypothetical protein